MTEIKQYKKGYSPSSLQRKYSLSYEQGHQLAEDFKRLQEQLNEANEIIANFRTYDFTRDDEIAEEYQVKYGIAGEKIYTNKKPPKEFERWRKKITNSFEKKLKSGV